MGNKCALLLQSDVSSSQCKQTADCRAIKCLFKGFVFVINWPVMQIFLSFCLLMQLSTSNKTNMNCKPQMEFNAIKSR